MREIAEALRKHALVLFGIAALLATSMAAPSAAQIRLPEAKPVAFVNVTVIDMTGAGAQSGMTVLIDSESIVALGPVGNVDVPVGVEIVDATGKYMIPGLWDIGRPRRRAEGSTLGLPRKHQGLFDAAARGLFRVSRGGSSARHGSAVVVRGRHLDRAALDGLLEHAKARR